MKVATCKVDPQLTQQAKTLGTWWVQCGDTVLLNTKASEWTTVKRKAEKIGLALKEYPDDVAKEDLHLVIQKGRLFQKEYLNVPILVDKGRYLIVRLTPNEAKKIGVRKEPCFGIQPLKMNTVIFDIRPPPARGIERIAWVQSLVNQVARLDYETALSHLVSYLNRYSTNSSYSDAAVWCREQLDIMGYTTSLESISVDGGSSCNIIADKTGAGSTSRKLVLVVAHLDSINTAGGSSASAPGADDNASGSAGLLQVAAVLKDHPSIHDLRFVLFGGEEQGLDGSMQYVAMLSATDRSRIWAVVNMDMIGALNTTFRTVLLEGSTVSQAVINDLSNAASTYTSLTVQTSLSPYASDHVPFINAGLPAVLTIEGADGANSAVHTANDTIDTIDYDLALEILRMNVGYVAAKLGKKGGVTMNEFELSEIKEYLKNIEEHLGTGGPLRIWRTSGRYKYNGGTSVRAALSARATRTEYPVAALEVPIYKVEDLFQAKPLDSWKELFKLRFTLHIDIDGTDPLNIVSGTVSRRILGGTPPHFIGRVTSNTLASGVRNLVVEDFSFQWPGASDIINKLEIQITGGSFVKHTAEVAFLDSTGNRKYGPYSVEQESIYFHDLEIEVDREDHAQDVEPYNTHTHPDRPADLPEEDLTFEKVFARAGIRITRSSGSNTINTSDVPGGTWSYQELHDAMEDHWAAFSNNPQWKMWIFLAELAEDSGLGGVMFDGYIDEPGGVDRQGTTVFTKCAFYHDVTGAYIQDNPPEAEAVKRELFFNYIHESGHMFNLAHNWQKELGNPWTPPSWMPLTNDPQAVSIMNYPELATQAATGSTDYNATWFYERFRFTFIDDELLFLRHAPGAYVQMGNEDWFENHGRVSRSSLDRRLDLVVRSRKKIVEIGEPVFIELRLRNKSDKPVTIPAVMDPADVFTEVAITNPRGERRPFIPFLRTRMQLQLHTLEPGDCLYEAINVTMGMFGFPFKEPGPYRIEVSYRATHGGTAAAVMQLWVRPPANYDDMPIISELFNARIGRVLHVGGSRLMEDVNEKFDWVINNLSKAHPAKYYLSAVKGMPLAKAYKVLRADSNRVRLLAPDPENAERLMTPLIEDMNAAADSLGHITYKQIVDTYTKSAVDVAKKSRALKAQENLLQMFEKRGVARNVIEKIQQRIRELK